MDILIKSRDNTLLIAVNSAAANPRSPESTTVLYFAKDWLNEKPKLEEASIPLPFKDFIAQAEAAQQAGKIADMTPEGIAAFKKSVVPAKALRRDFSR